MTLTKAILLLALAAYVAIIVFVYFSQRQLMYFPSMDQVKPGEVGLNGVRAISLATASGLTLESWYGEAREGRPTILFFHGNGGALAGRQHRFRDLMAEGFGIFMQGYPGYGGNDGIPSEDTFREASRRSYQFLREQGIAARDIVLYGESIGSGVAVQLAAAVDARGLVLEAPMISTLSVASALYPYFPVSLLLKDKYLSDNYIDKINMPLLVMHGDKDSIIPIESGQALFSLAQEPKSFVVMEGAGHNDLQSYPVVEIVRPFVDGQ